MVKVKKCLSPAKLAALDKLHKLPRSAAQMKSARRLGELPKLPRNGQRIFPNTMAEHHNDLCHGALRPDDVTYMTFKKHGNLHAKLQLENGTHNFLTKNRRRKP